VALSFVRRPDDVLAARAAMRDLGGEVPLVAKLERPEALEALEEILRVSDAVMVARGDLGVEVAVERVPTIQKRVISRASAHAAPVITATQMLESMISSARPTRAEASDVANAVFDGSDAVMLSGETAVGRYPVEAVRAMVRIAAEAETAPNLVHPSPPPVGALDAAATVCKAAVSAAADLDAKAVVVFTETGATARMVSRFRPRAPIVAFATTEETRRRMALLWGVEAPACLLSVTSTDKMLEAADTQLVKGSWAAPGDLVVAVTGVPGKPGATNQVTVHRVGGDEGA
jgi:pyruvate kinase